MTKSPIQVAMGRTLQLLLVGLLVLGMLSGCSEKHQQVHSLLPETTTTNTGVHIHRHRLGKIRIPIHPQRVVILHDFLLEDALTLGVKPIGAPQIAVNNLYLDPLTAKGIVDVGFFSTNIEKVLALKPDLILGSDVIQKDIYELLSHIAPTVLVRIKSVQDWKGHLMQVATILGKTERAQKVIADYNSRILSFRATMGAKLSHTQVSIIGVGGFSSGTLRILHREKDSFPISILQEAGLVTMLLPTSGVSDHLLKIGPSGLYLVSVESLSIVDGDVIFVILPGDWYPKGNFEVQQTALKRLQSLPLWSKLKAVQHGQVYRVGIYWISSGPISANLALDDLFKYLHPLTKI
ncbi:MAG: iron-siderophore ABC transporter substrate-binding protein [Nostoc sp.]|uniref:iron-siderophore ABC transporter substrate-binding protein n=1 Tax=Nostoc sp. TaxID=1180 RepID=UPI002FF5BE69